MGNINTLLQVVDPAPSTEFIKIATLLRKHEILMSMEKTAEVSRRRTEREQEILDAFYKEAGLLSGAATVGKSLWNAGKAGMRRAVSNYGDVGGGVRGVMHSAGAGAKRAVRSFSNSAGANALRQGGRNIKQFGQQVANSGPVMNVRTNPAIMGSNFAKTGEEQMAYALMSAGHEFAKTANMRVNIEEIAEPLEKLAVIGALNYKLRTAVASEGLSKEAKAHAYRLGRENNEHCIDVLKDISEKADPDFFF